MKLTSEEIQKFASRKGVRKIAVENFLGTIDTDYDTRVGCIMNCHMDAELYKWNRPTVIAIESGIRALFDKASEHRK